MLNENLQHYRKKKGLSQEELAAELNVVRQTVSKWEKGLSVPDSEMLCSIAEVLDIPVTVLLGEKAAEDAAAVTESEKLDRIAEKLEVINAQLARQSAQKRRFWRTICFLAAALCVFVLFFDLMQTQYMLNTFYSPGEASSLGVIGGADGPTAIFVTSRFRPSRAIFLVLGFCLALFGIIRTGRKKD